MIVSQTESTPAGGNSTECLATAVHVALSKSPYLAADRYRVEAGEGHVRLHGEAVSFFEKQMAQETVLRLDGVQRVENLLQVSWT